MTPPIIVGTAPECAFYRAAANAVALDPAVDDGVGQTLEREGPAERDDS
jgi:hypothetical protein